MPLNDGTQCLYLIRLLEALQLHQLCIAARRENSCQIQHISDASGHTSGKVRPGFTQHSYQTACHVLASVRACTLYNRQRPTIAYSEALTGTASDETLSTGCTVEHRIAENDVIVRCETRIGCRRLDDLPRGHGLSHLVHILALPYQVQAGLGKNR